MAEPAKEVEICVNYDFNPCFTKNIKFIHISKAAFLDRQTQKFCIGHTLDKNTNMIELVFFLLPIKNESIPKYRTLHVQTFNIPFAWDIQTGSSPRQGIDEYGLNLTDIGNDKNFPYNYSFKLYKNQNISVISHKAFVPIKSLNASAYDNVCFTENAKYITLVSTTYYEETCIGATFQENSLNADLKFYIASTYDANIPYTYILTAKKFNAAKNIKLWFKSAVAEPYTKEIIFDRNDRVMTLAFIRKFMDSTNIEIKLSSLSPNVRNKTLVEYSEWHKEKNYNCIINNLDIETINVESNDGGNFTIIKDILTENSDVFKAMFESDMYEANNKTVRIKELNTIQLKSFIKYMLTGDINSIAESDLVEMLNLAEKYNMNDFKQWIESRLWNGVKHENCIEMYEIATKFKLSLLEKKVEEMLLFQKSVSLANIKPVV